MDESSYKLYESWRWNPLKFVEEVIFLDTPAGWKPSTQQKEALRLLGKFAKAKYKAGTGQKLTKEEEGLARKKGISIRSGHGTGKDAWLAWVFCWLLICFYMARGLVTAPTGHQLDAVLWGELRKWIRMSTLLTQLLEVKSDKVYLKELKGEAFVEARTANVKATAEEQAETLAGRHSDYMILAGDEASGIPSPIFQPIEGALTGIMNFAVLIGNPTRSSGYFFDTHMTDKRERWLTLHWSSEDSELVNKYELESEQSEYGRDSNWYRVRRLGEFPRASDDTLIPFDWIMDAKEREVIPSKDDPVVIGVDVADEEGESKSIICERHGRKIVKLWERQTSDTMEITGWVSRFIDEQEPDGVAIDSLGVGSGVYHRLREQGHRISGVKTSRSSTKKEMFCRLRDELWWKLRTWFEEGIISIPNDDELVGQLAAIKYKPDSAGRIKVESKFDMRKRGLKSPDKADAICLSLYFSERALLERRKEENEWERDLLEESVDYNHSWMRA